MQEDKLLRLFLGWSSPHLALQMWDGRLVSNPPQAKVKIIFNSPEVLRRFVRPTLGSLATAYVEGEIDIEGTSEDILTVAEEVVGGTFLPRRSFFARLWRFFPSWLSHSPKADARAIHSHYDISNEFYSLFLDSQMVYSCAYFRDPTMNLDEAQEAKLDHTCKKLLLRPEERFLDIGCGWGALVVHAAKHYGVRAAGVTLSQNQYDHARQWIEKEGLEKRARVFLQDYRKLDEKEPFDKIASVGMFEHVGWAHLGEYFSKVQRLLVPGGVFLNHGITSGAVGGGGLGSGAGRFMDKYVFPRGELVHVAEVIRKAAGAGLEPWDLECLRPHYEKTLRQWVQRLEAKEKEAIAITGEKAYRIWRIYMAGAAHGFSRGWMSVCQLVALKPEASGRLPLPWTRDYIYAEERQAKPAALPLSLSEAG